jgi:hypothetical protein
VFWKQYVSYSGSVGKDYLIALPQSAAFPGVTIGVGSMQNANAMVATTDNQNYVSIRRADLSNVSSSGTYFDCFTCTYPIDPTY